MNAKYHVYLILFVVFILTHFIQLTNKESEYITDSNLEYSAKVGVIAWGKLPSCTMWLNNLRLSLPDCHAWSSAGEVTIIGKVERGSAADRISQKILIEKVIYTFDGDEGSLKNRLVNFLNLTSFHFNQRRAVIFSNLEEKDRSLLQALLFGQSSSGLSAQLHHSFTQAGVVNLISVSSYCFSLTIELLLILSKRFSERKKLAELMTVIIVNYFVLLVGYPLALQRVVLTLCIDLLGQRLFHRPITGVYRLLLSSLIILAINPFALFDVGLEFSVLASLGIQLFSQPPQLLYKLSSVFPSPWGRKLVQVFWLSVTAQLFTWPLIFYYFGEMSLMSPISNIVILWILPTILTLGVGYWMIGQFYLPILPACTPVLSALLAIFKAELHVLASLGFIIQFQPQKEHLVLGYCLMSFLTVLLFFNHKRHLVQSIYHNLYS